MSEKVTEPAGRSRQNAREIAEARFEKLFEDAEALSIQGYLPDGTVVYWNRASEAIYGYSAEEALGGNLLDLIIPAEMRSIVEGAVRWMFESGQGIPAGRLELRHKDGRKVPVYSCHTVVAVPGESPILFCMDTDMSALDSAEAELRIAATAFESQQGMLITDRRGVILRINQSFAQATGYTAAQTVGRPLRILRSNQHPPGFYSEMWSALLLSGSWQGEISTKRKNGEISADWVTFTAVRDASGGVTHYVGTQTDITLRKQAEAKIIHLAFYDPLTHLPNRRLLQDRLQQALSAIRHNQSCGALLFIDVDNFKTLNDTQGHIIGDLLLQQVAERLKTSIRASDTAGRLGGDEFVVMLEDLGSDLHEAAGRSESTGRTLLALLSQQYTLNDLVYEGSVSIGVALFSPPGSSVAELMKQADLALYEAKAAGRNTLRFFDAEMQAAVTLRAELVSGLREGVAKGEFFLHYQPQVDSHDRIIGAELLLRWDRPRHGMVPPTLFIPVAEESGLIHPLGDWVLETACDRLVAWGDQPVLAQLTLAVNVSARQFARSDFVAHVTGILVRTGADPRRLKLELTESLLISDIDDVVEKMTALKRIGVSFSLDDFGTGYSSLAYLQRLPLDQLKIDRSFVRNLLTDQSSVVIAQTIIALGGSMGLSVIAEGVEEEGVRRILGDLGCMSYQGNLFGRPMAVEEFQALATLSPAPRTVPAASSAPRS